MTDHDIAPLSDAARRGQVDTAAAEVYETFFVPALFGQFVEPVLTHADVGEGDSLLDVGCGTGIVARAARRVVGPDGHVSGVDPNDGMLAVAERSDPTVEWRSGVVESLPFDDGSFDRVVSQFAAMFFVDRGVALDEMARVAKPGGSVTIAIWCSLDETPGYDAMVRLVADEIGEDAADALRAPFVLGDTTTVDTMMRRIGRDVTTEVIEGEARFDSLAAWLHTDIRGWTLSAMVDDAAEASLAAKAERDLAGFVDADGTVSFPAPAIVSTATIER